MNADPTPIAADGESCLGVILGELHDICPHQLILSAAIGVGSAFIGAFKAFLSHHSIAVVLFARVT
jgi:hypothetical protein